MAKVANLNNYCVIRITIMFCIVNLNYPYNRSTANNTQ